MLFVIALLSTPLVLGTSAPDTFTVNFKTDISAASGSDIEIEIIRKWAPLGAEHFYTLVESNFFNEVAFFRYVPDFIVQFGISGDPATNVKWSSPIPDDPFVGNKNLPGTLVYATAGPNTRTTQFFINFADNSFLDTEGFVPIGRVKTGLQTAIAAHNPTPEDTSGNGIDQQDYTTKGNDWIWKAYPRVNFIKSASIMSTPSPSPSLTLPSLTPSVKPSQTPSPTPSAILSSPTPSPSALPSPTPSIKLSHTVSVTPSPSLSFSSKGPTATSSVLSSPKPSFIPSTPSATPNLTSARPPTVTQSPVSASSTPSPTPSLVPSTGPELGTSSPFLQPPSTVPPYPQPSAMTSGTEGALIPGIAGIIIICIMFVSASSILYWWCSRRHNRYQAYSTSPQVTSPPISSLDDQEEEVEVTEMDPVSLQET